MGILKLSAPFITSPLTYICNKSLSTGTFPERLKYALIRPVYKKGDKHLVTNYRPISLLTSFSKIFEKLIFTRLYKHLYTNGILAKEQYGFRSNSSTQNAAYDIIAHWEGYFATSKRPSIVLTIKSCWTNLNFMGLEGNF